MQLRQEKRNALLVIEDIGKSDHTIVEVDIAILCTTLPEGKHPEGKRGHASTFASTTSAR